MLSEEEDSSLKTEARKSYDECINDIKILLKAKDNNEHRIVNIDLISEAALNASANGCLEILESLITYESSIIDVKDNEGNSLLMLAAKNGHLDIIPKLMDWYKNANKNSADNSYEKFLNKTNENNYTALMLAAENGHEAVVKTFVEKYKVKSRDAKQASDVAQSQIENLSKKNRNGSKNEIISSYKSIKNILDIRKKEAEKNEALDVEKVEKVKTYWPIFLSNKSLEQLSSLENDLSLKYIYDEVILQLSNLKANACPSTKKIEKLASGLMAIRLNGKHRLVYDIDGDEIHIISCKDHYPNQENKRSRKDVLKGVKFDTQWTNGNFVPRNETNA
jgi:ankyrin repeat protein